jgi:hypothetical protein
MTRGFELRGSEVARPRIEGARSEHASRSRRVTTTADFRAMREQRTPPRRHDNLRRFSRTAKQCADSIGAVVSCSRMLLAAEKRLASPKCGTALRLPFGSPVESWLPRPSACPRPSPIAVPRVGDASPLFVSCSCNRAWNPPTSSSLRDEKHVPSLLLSTPARDFPTLAAPRGGAYRVRSFRFR